MNKYYLFLSLLFFVACNDTEDDSDIGNWVKHSDFEGVTRSGAVSFTIGDYAYVGLGTDGDDYVNDFWRYDPERNFWQEMATFPGSGRIAAVAFSANGKGYVGTGFNGDLDTEELADFWEYDPATNEWTERASFEGGARYSAVAFTVNGQGYIGTGFDGNYLKDFWRYDESSDSWTQTVSLFGSKRESAIAFVMDGVAYVGSGRNNGQYLFDFWSFSPESETWNDLSIESDDDNYDTYVSALGRYSAVAFVGGDRAFITTGIADSYLRSVYSYDPVSNHWGEGFTAFEGTARANAVAFVLNGTGYVVSGRSSTQRHDDIWGFDPFDEYDEYD